MAFDKKFTIFSSQGHMPPHVKAPLMFMSRQPLPTPGVNCILAFTGGPWNGAHKQFIAH